VPGPFRAFDGFDWHALHSPSRSIAEADTLSLTYGEAARKVRQVLAGFRALGVEHGDRIAIVAKNRPETVLLLLAALKGGPVVVPVNHRLSAAEMAWVIADSGAKAVIVESEFAAGLQSLLPQSVLPAANWSLHGATDGCLDFNAWLDQQADEPVDPPNTTETAYLQVYTSGTTGRPKGVVLTEQNCLGQQLGLMACLDVSVDPGDRFLQSLPLFHVGGIFVSLWAIYHGATLVLPKDFSAEGTDALLASGTVAHVVMVPAMIKACLGLPTAPVERYVGMKSLWYGASPISEPVLRGARERFGCPLIQIYGMTETHSLISMLNAQDHERAFSGQHPELLMSAGRPVAGVDLRILGDDGKTRLSGESGEISVKAPQVMAGYWGRKDATEEVLWEGRLYTGDAGYLDPEGYLFIVDRLKDIIVSGGENISSREVEDVLLLHPNVADAAVIGVPDERWGEAVKAVVVTRDGDADWQDIIDHCRKHLGGFKVPKSVSLVDVIPRNGTGKIQKTVLRERFWKGHARRVS
jgi:acyl-CoA synthetase (AMP-forming)/AMP-acid ligase II